MPIGGGLPCLERRRDVGCAKIVADEKQRGIVFLGQRVSEAIAKVQPGACAKAFAEADARLNGSARKVFIDGGNGNAAILQKGIEISDALLGITPSARKHGSRFDIIGRGHQAPAPGFGGKTLAERIGATFVQHHSDDGR